MFKQLSDFLQNGSMLAVHVRKIDEVMSIHTLVLDNTTSVLQTEQY